jgi:hypothetical protein
MSMIGRWLEEHGSELDALIAKIGKETGRRTTVEGVACDMLDQALEVFRGIQEYFLVNRLPPVCASSCSGDHVTVNKCVAGQFDSHSNF